MVKQAGWLKSDVIEDHWQAWYTSGSKPRGLCESGKQNEERNGNWHFTLQIAIAKETVKETGRWFGSNIEGHSS